jgi:hypothetical protein
MSVLSHQRVSSQNAVEEHIYQDMAVFWVGRE